MPRLLPWIAFAAWLGVACDGPDSAGPPAPSGSASGPLAIPSASAGPAPGARQDLAREGSAIALSGSGKELFVADEDHSKLVTIPLPLGGSPAQKKDLAGRPAQVAVLGDQVLVTVRQLPSGKGGLLFFKQGADGQLNEEASLELPADAWGIGTSPDGTMAAVTSAWTAKVSLVDLATRKVTSTLEVAREPRAAVFTADGQSVFISHLIGAPLTRIDQLRDPKVTRVELPAAPNRSPAAEKLTASLGYALVPNPERDRLFAPRHALGAIGSDVWFGTASVDAIDVEGSTPVVQARQVNTRQSYIEPVAKELQADDGARMFNFAWAASFDFVRLSFSSFTQPRAAVYRKSQRTLLVASEGGGTLLELDATLSDPMLRPVRGHYAAGSDQEKEESARCRAPSGIALSPDERTAYVMCRASDQVVAMALEEGEGKGRPAPSKFVRFADPPADKDYAAGRELFFDAHDGHLSGGLGCAACHPEGRDDGFVWHEVEFDSEQGKFTNFFGSASSARTMSSIWKQKLAERNATPAGVGFARQTPMLAGRVKAKGPYGWRAENKDLESRVLAGFALHRWREGEESNYLSGKSRSLATFVRTGLVPPPIDPSPLSAEEEQGKAIFLSDKTGCATCHTPESDYTNRGVASFAPFPQRGYAEEKGALFKTPSLLFVGGSAPYFHDGRFATLEQVIEKNGDQMGKTSHLSDTERKALVAYLRRL